MNESEQIATLTAAARALERLLDALARAELAGLVLPDTIQDRMNEADTLLIALGFPPFGDEPGQH